jgi:outer membrane protein
VKKIQWIFNLVFAIALLILYILYFQKGSSSFKGSSTDEKDSSVATHISIAYVNTDSLFKDYDYYKEMEQRLENEKLNAERQFEKRIADLEKTYNSLMVMVKKGMITEEKAAQDFSKKEQEIEAYRKEVTQQLLKKEQELTESVFSDFLDYIKSYNTEAKYSYILGYAKGGGILSAPDEYDITQEILEGLNKNYRDRKQNQN